MARAQGGGISACSGLRRVLGKRWRGGGGRGAHRREQVGQKGGEEAAPEQVEAEHDEEHLRDAVRCD